MGAMKITALCCSNALYEGLAPGEYSRAYVEGVQIIETPCSGKVDPIYLLKAFEKGADLVVVLACDQRLCATIEGSKRIHKRIERTKHPPRRSRAGARAAGAADRAPAGAASRSIGLFKSIKEAAKELGPSPVR